MKKRILLSSVLVMFVLVAVTVPVSANAVKTAFTGISVVAGPPISFGECTYPGGNVHCRGMILVTLDTISDPRLSGVETIVANYNFIPASAPILTTGPMWGTSQIVNDGGYWEYTWTGVRDEQGFMYMRGAAHGHGGYEGLQAFFTGVRESPDPAATLVYTGYILEP